MHHPKLHSSQELTVQQVNAEQTFSPSTAASGFSHSSPSASQPSGSRVPFAPGSPIGQAPGGSSSTATASIVRPAVRHRPEWAASLEDVEPYGLPTSFVCSYPQPGGEVPVRYIADHYDRSWLVRRMGGCLAQSANTNYARGKTGQMGCSLDAGSDLGISLLEDIITAFELAAYFSSEVPLERLNGIDGVYLEGVSASTSVVNEVRQYWLRKREAVGGHIPWITALRLTVREDNQSALCHPDVLGDCPLPFKRRDWLVPTIAREEPSPKLPDVTRTKLKRNREGSLSSPRVPEQFAYVRTARLLSEEILRREQLRHQHVLASLYELAALRRLSEPQKDFNVSPWDWSRDETHTHWNQTIPFSQNEKERLMRCAPSSGFSHGP